MAAKTRILIVDNDVHLHRSASAFPDEHLILVKPRKQAGTDNETETKTGGAMCKSTDHGIKTKYVVPYLLAAALAVAGMAVANEDDALTAAVTASPTRA